MTWKVVGAAVRGAAHDRQGLPCQDAAGWQVLEDGTLLAAAADGAGSAGRSDEGARLAVQAALGALAGALAGCGPAAGSPPVDDLEENLQPFKEGAAGEGGSDGVESNRGPGASPFEPALRAAFGAARAAVLALAEVEGEPAREFASTLTVAAADGACLAVGVLGDGAAVARRPDGTFFTAGRPQRGEFANETFFLTGEGALEQASVETAAGPVAALAVMSDGLTRLALRLPSGEPFEPFFDPLFAFAAAGEDEASARLEAFLGSERVCARTDDDKALILAVRDLR